MSLQLKRSQESETSNLILLFSSYSLLFSVFNTILADLNLSFLEQMTKCTLKRILAHLQFSFNLIRLCLLCQKPQTHFYLICNCPIRFCCPCIPDNAAPLSCLRKKCPSICLLLHGIFYFTISDRFSRIFAATSGLFMVYTWIPRMPFAIRSMI